MTTLTSGIAYADFEFQGLQRIIATVTLTGADGVTVVDPGPTTTLPALERHLASIGASIQDITALFITHIHLDHAGAAGTLIQRNPRIKVFVHEVGAPHMVDPSKLVASAGRLYGDDMDRLWGAVTPVTPAALVPLKGGERLDRAGRRWDVAYTPGHASHHVSYFSPDSGIAFVGDTAGVQVLSGGFVLPPTPPPDIDLPAWTASLALIRAVAPADALPDALRTVGTRSRAHCRTARSPAVRGAAGARGDRTFRGRGSARSVVHRTIARGDAAAHQRRGPARLRDGRTVRLELARNCPLRDETH